MATKIDTNTSSAADWRSYAALLSGNQAFRTFWLAGAISQLGNWFNYLAVFVLIAKVSPTGQAIGWFLIAKFLPSAVFGPAAGIVADRFSRKAIMIACDLARVVIVLLFLVVEQADSLWLVYTLAIIQETMWTFANPARQASVPNLCSRDELRLANALSGATWSMLLAFGAALGGFVTATFGWQTAIVIDAATFLISARMISLVPIPRRHSPPTTPSPDHPQSVPPTQGRKKFCWQTATGLSDMQAGYRYVRGNKKVAALLLVKSGWALSGGILVMLTWFGEQIFKVGEGGGSGILYSARGFGAAIGPLLAWRLLGESSTAMYRGIAVSFFISAASYLCFSQAPNLAVAALFVFSGHLGGAIQWVFSTTLLQQTVPDFVRGRVFAAEMAVLTLVLSLSTWCTGRLLDTGASPRLIVAGLALLFLVPGLSWTAYLAAAKGKASPAE